MNKHDLLLHPTLDEGFKVNFLRRLYLDDKNLLSNPGFETDGVGDPDFWADWVENVSNGTLANETTLVHEGVNAVKMIQGAGIATGITQAAIAVVAGKLHQLRFWTRGDGTYGGRYNIWSSGNGYLIPNSHPTGVTGTTYTEILKLFTPTVSQNATLYLKAPGTNGGVCYWDTFSLFILN